MIGQTQTRQLWRLFCNSFFTFSFANAQIRTKLFDWIKHLGFGPPLLLTERLSLIINKVTQANSAWSAMTDINAENHEKLECPTSQSRFQLLPDSKRLLSPVVSCSRSPCRMRLIFSQVTDDGRSRQNKVTNQRVVRWSCDILCLLRCFSATVVTTEVHVNVAGYIPQSHLKGKIKNNSRLFVVGIVHRSRGVYS